MGDRVEALRQAVERLRALHEVSFVDASPLYQTEPWEQRPGEAMDRGTWFFNCVVAIDTTLPALVVSWAIAQADRLKPKGAGLVR